MRGRFGDAPVAHLTVGTSDDEAHLDLVERTLRARLVRPLDVAVDRVTVSEERRATGTDRWTASADVLLGR